MYRKQNLDMTRYRGLSTDTKPDADFGSTFHEMDTGDIYRFDGSEWQKCGSLAGTDPSIYMSMWGARGNTKKAWALSALAGGHSDPGILKTVTGNPISVSDALAARIQSLSVSLSPIQEGSGDPSPDNVRPITGRDSVTVTRTGKNLLNPAFSAFDLVGTYRAQKMPDTGFTLSIKDKGNGEDISGIYFGITEYGINANGYIAWLIQNGTIKFTEKYTPAYRYVTIYPTGQATLNKLLARFDIQAEFNTAASAYEPYQAQQVTVQLGQTVYGGTVDVTGGSAESEAIKITANDLPTPSVDSGNTGDGYYSFNFGLPAGKYAVSGKQLLSKCNILPYIDSGKTTRYSFFYMLERHFRQLRILVYSETELTKDTVKQWLSDHGFELVYYTDPTPLTLDPATLSTLKGQNNVWSDGDDISMTYKAVSS